MAQKNEYGNITLAQMNDLLLSLFGKDFFLALCGKFYKEWGLEYFSDGAFEKEIGRLLCKEQGDLSLLGASSNSISCLLRDKVLPFVRERYGLNIICYQNAIDSIIHECIDERLDELTPPICGVNYVHMCASPKIGQLAVRRKTTNLY